MPTPDSELPPRNMTVLLIVAHDPLASALRTVAAHAFPERVAQVAAIDLRADEPDAEARVRAVLEAHAGGDVLILADAFGASPCSACLRAAAGVPHVRVVTGVNVPMLWRTLGNPNLPLDELARRALDGAVQGVMQANPTPRQNQPNPKHDQDPNNDQ